MRSISFINPVVRATVVIGAVAALVTGVTFAALQSQATLTDNTIASATAALQVNNTDDATNGLGSTDVGFAFSDLLPGADYGPAKHFSLKNNGTADLKVTVKATGTTTTGTIDKAKVHIKFTNTDTSTSAEYTMDELETLDNDVPGVSGADFLDASPAETNNFNMQVKMDADAVTGSSASLSGFSLVFTGASF